MSSQYWYWLGFGPSTLIIMADKTLKEVSQLQWGDQVSCGNNKFSTVHKIVSVTSEQPFQMCNHFGVLLTARSIVKNENDEWKYCCTLSDDSTHCTSPTIIQIELDSIFEIECAGNDNKTIVCMTKNHIYDTLVYDAVLSENIDESNFCCYCGDNCVNDGKVFQSYCGEIDYCSMCVPIIHLAIKSK